MTPDRERLILDTLPLVERVAGAFVRRLPAHADKDAVRGAAVEGLVDAAARFDGRADSWGGYCRLKVMGAMLDQARQLDPARNRSNTVRVEGYEVPLLEADRVRAPDEFARARSRVDLIRAISKLPARQGSVVATTEILDRPVAAVASSLGLHEARVSQIRTEAFRALRPRLG